MRHNLTRSAAAQLIRRTKDEAGALFLVEAACGTPCKTCPWRLSNQAQPPLENPKATHEVYYAPEGREILWRRWPPDDPEGFGVCEGRRQRCHAGVNTAVGIKAAARTGATLWRWCASTDGLLQRELLRWFDNGRARHAFEPLSGLVAIQRIIATVLGRYDLEDIDVAAGTAGQVQPRFESEPISYETVVRLAHPAVTDPAIGCEDLQPLSADEIEKWTRGNVGADWETGPAQGTTWWRNPE